MSKQITPMYNRYVREVNSLTFTLVESCTCVKLLVHHVIEFLCRYKCLAHRRVYLDLLEDKGQRVPNHLTVLNEFLTYLLTHTFISLLTCKLIALYLGQAFRFTYEIVTRLNAENSFIKIFHNVIKCTCLNFITFTQWSKLFQCHESFTKIIITTIISVQEACFSCNKQCTW